jgi:hypothetical protein
MIVTMRSLLLPPFASRPSRAAWSVMWTRITAPSWNAPSAAFTAIHLHAEIDFARRSISRVSA